MCICRGEILFCGGIFLFRRSESGRRPFPQFPQFEECEEELSLCHPERSEGSREHQAGVHRDFPPFGRLAIS